MANSPNLQVPWYKRADRKTLDERIKAVQNVNDPTIVADDVQRWSTRFLYLLLAFTTLLSAFSYYKFFEPSFGVFALFMALALAATIEFGKNWGFLKVLRIPFFLGWRHIQSEVQETVMWAGLLLLSIATFGASVYNSTHGAKQLSLLLGNERNYTEFVPNTSAIDAQILATQSSMSQNRGIKWKGTVTYQAQKAIQKESSSLDKLQDQRAATISQQRQDFEAKKALESGQNNFSASTLLMVGGFVELLQFLLMFMRVASERSLDKVATERNFKDVERKTNGFTDFGVYEKSGSGGGNRNINNKGPIGFFKENPYRETVPQPPQPVAQPPQVVSNAMVLGCNQVLLQLKGKVQSDLPNLRSGNGSRPTIHKRIVKAFDQAFEVIRHNDFQPDRIVGIQVYNYLIDAIEALNSMGWPYERDVFFLKRLSDILEATEQPV